MAQQSPQTRRTPTEIVRVIHERTLAGYRPIEIDAELQKRFPGTFPSRRTVEYIAREVAPRDISGVWRLPEATDEEASVILPVLAVVIERTEGRTRQLSADEARWVARLMKAAPDLPPWEAYRLARLYLSRTSHGTDPWDLDVVLAFAPWRDGGKRYVNAFARHWLKSVLWSEFIEGDAEHELMEEVKAERALDWAGPARRHTSEVAAYDRATGKKNLPHIDHDLTLEGMMLCERNRPGFTEWRRAKLAEWRAERVLVEHDAHPDPEAQQ